MFKSKIFNYKNQFLVDSKGFTLVEVLVAMSILMLVVFAYTALFTSSFEGIFRAGEKSEGLFLAQKNIENLVAIREAGTGQVLDINFPNTAEYEIWGRKQEVETLVTFISEEKPLIRFVAVGNTETINGNKAVITSPLGNSWEEFDSDLSFTLNDITWGGMGDNKSYLAVGAAGRITSSRDGRIWVSITTDTINVLHAVTWGGIWGDYTQGISGDLKYVAVGNSSTIITSIDGITWVSVDVGDLPSAELKGICWGMISDTEGYFIAIGSEGTILYSSDGEVWNVVDWSEHPEFPAGPELNLNDIFYADGKYIAVGAVGAVGDVVGSIIVLTFPLGETVPSIEIADPDYPVLPVALNGITYGNNQYVAVGDAGTILVSVDGLSWSVPNPPGTTSDDLNEVTWSYNRFMAVGDNKIVTSENGNSWVVVNSDSFTLHGITGR